MHDKLKPSIDVWQLSEYILTMVEYKGRLPHIWKLYLSWISDNPVAVLLISAITFLLLGWGQNGINLDSSTYSVIARNMVEHGQWFNPTYTPYSHPSFAEHPPLVMWVQAFIFWLFGANDSTARLFGAICTMGSALAVFWLGREVSGKALGLLGGLVLILTYNFMQGGNSTLLDYPMSFFVLVTLAGLARLQSSRIKDTPWWVFIVTGLALGFSFLAKGVVSGPVWAAVGIAALMHRNWLKKLRFWIIPGLAIGLVALYLLLDQIYANGHFAHHYFLIQVWRRFIDGGPEISTEWYEFLFRFCTLYLPWIILLPIGIYSAIKKKKNVLLPLGITLLLYAIFYSNAAKLYYHYFAPVYALSALFVAMGLRLFLKDKLVPKVAAVFLIIWVLTGIGVASAGVRIHHVRCAEVYNLTSQMTNLLQQSNTNEGVMVCSGEPNWDIIAKTAWYWRSNIAWTVSLDNALEMIRSDKRYTYLLLPQQSDKYSIDSIPDDFVLYTSNDKLAVFILSSSN